MHCQVLTADEPCPAVNRTSDEQPIEDQESHQQLTVKEAFQARLAELKLKYKHVPDRYRGYEALLDVGDDPTDNIPKGMHAYVHTLCAACK